LKLPSKLPSRCFYVCIVNLAYSVHFKQQSTISMHSFIHLAVCLTTCPKLFPKPALHIVRSTALFFRCEYPLLCRLMSYIYIYIYIYMSYRTANLQTLHFKCLFNKYPYCIFWTCCIISVSLSSKCRLFHNYTLFGTCIIHILNTECAKI
jgi:hypothetical protein